MADADRREFTSINAHTEACEQFIVSRRGLGWAGYKQVPPMSMQG